jgi:hypothetical protein
MSVTPTDRLASVLPVVISGGRPSVWERLTGKFLPALHGVTADPVWVVRDDEAPGYQPDGREIITYPRDWAEDWARAHWTDVRPYQAGGFLGGFPGREWACQEAGRRGYWAVLMLDDNIRRLSVMQGSATACRVAEEAGGLGLYADLLAAVTLSSNAAMCGAQLMAVNPADEIRVFARAGFCYSLFIERLGEGREPWHGPSEDDIIHAFSYGRVGSRWTTAVVVPLRYQKEHTKGGGLRGWYDDTRSAGLQRLFPQSARLTVQVAHANGRGAARLFHTMVNDAIATPLIIEDAGLFGAARDRARELVAASVAERKTDIAKILATRAEGARRRQANAARRAATKYRED